MHGPGIPTTNGARHAGHASGLAGNRAPLMPLSARRAPPSAAPASPVSSSDAAGSVSVRRSAFLPLDPLLGARLGDLPDGVEVVGEDDDRLLLEIAALQERAELLDLRVRRARREVDHPPEGVLLRRARIALHAARDPLDLLRVADAREALGGEHLRRRGVELAAPARGAELEGHDGRVALRPRRVLSSCRPRMRADMALQFRRDLVSTDLEVVTLLPPSGMVTKRAVWLNFGMALIMRRIMTRRWPSRSR